MNFGKVIKITLLILIALINDLSAQDSSKIIEKNLNDKSSESLTEEKSSESTESKKSEDSSENYQESPLLKQARDSLAGTLLGKDNKKSLMFDDQEYDNLERAVDSLINNKAYKPDGENSDQNAENLDAQNNKKVLEFQENEKSYIYLASIIYFNSKDWIVWINDKKITSKTNDRKKEIYIEKISRTSVKILWKLSLSKWKIISGKQEEFAPKVNSENQIEARFELKPNQTFVLSSNKVLEGKASINSQKNKEEVDLITETKK